MSSAQKGEHAVEDVSIKMRVPATLPKAARLALAEIAHQIQALTRQIDKLERGIVGEVKRDEDMRRLITFPGVGAITATSVKALVPDPEGFKSGRHFAAWLGLTPKPDSSGGKETARRHIENGESDAPLAACLWRDVGLATREGQQESAAVANRAFGAAAFQGSRGRACQQDREDHVGAAHQGRKLSKYWRGKRRSTCLSRTTTRTECLARSRTEARCMTRR